MRSSLQTSLGLFFLFMIGGVIIPRLSCAQQKFGQDRPPKVFVKTSKPESCDKGGFTFETIYVKSFAHEDEEVDVLLYFQKKNGEWGIKLFARKGSGQISAKLSSCDFTGNYYLKAAYGAANLQKFPDISIVSQQHYKKGTRPNFQIVQERRFNECKGESGYSFIAGQIFTPQGEFVDVTLFMEKRMVLGERNISSITTQDLSNSIFQIVT